MKITANHICEALEAVRRESPIIHNITNYVVMNSTANALLAVGASPVMAHAKEEVEEMVGIAQALVINIGTLSDQWIKAMFLAADQAAKNGIPIILDPVGSGATSYRTKTARDLIETCPPAIIRGNASEILSLSDDKTKTKGVDSVASSDAAIQTAVTLSKRYPCVVCVSGATDYIVEKDTVIKIDNGHPLMSRVTGLGCTASALCGAFAAVETSLLMAASSAMAVMGIAGEIAGEASWGPGSMQINFLDCLHRLSGKDIHEHLKIGQD